MVTTSTTMEPLSARIPSDLYLWLAQLQVEGATTNSDKLRVLLGQLKRHHDGALDYVAAHAWARDTTGRLRDSWCAPRARRAGIRTCSTPCWTMSRPAWPSS